ncbi:MAG: rRNA adenine N-6-methyltransferase family protein [Flavobacteriales bacterium]
MEGTRVCWRSDGHEALTRHLLERTDLALTAIELDAEAATYLRSEHRTCTWWRVTSLKLDEDPNARRALRRHRELPVQHQHQIVFRVLEHRDKLHRGGGRCSERGGRPPFAPPGSRTYGITSVLAQAWYDLESLFHVEPGSFIPPPRCAVR